MAQEIEIKLRIGDPKALNRALKRLGARPANVGGGRVHEWNVIFDTPEGGLAKHGQLLRIRMETPTAKLKKGKPKLGRRTVLTFKRPFVAGSGAPGNAKVNHRHKVREEFEVEVADAGILTSIFEGLGMRGWFRYEKYRTTFHLAESANWAKGLLIELDETPLGVFVELEGPAGAIDRAARELGYSRRDYVLKNYLVLYLEECRRQGKEPKDMVFAAQNSRRKRKQ
ncbi:MAG TPA: class IV adenylate cyclase [Candidatus Acidoferrum sp.]|nr:class IV adenylate cyclase [Candidatus Acidoferrum sp.]